MGLKVTAKIEKAVVDKTISVTEARDILKEAKGEVSPETQAQLRGLLVQPGVTIAPAARRALNDALPVDQRPDSFDWGNRQLSPTDKMWQLYMPGSPPPTDRGTGRFVQTGFVRAYALMILAGAVVLVGYLLWVPR